MHQIRFRLGLCPRPHWGSLQRSPDPQLDLRGLLLRGGKGGKEKGTGRDQEKGKGREGERGRRGGEGDRDGRESLGSQGEGKGTGQAKGQGRGNLGGQSPPNVFFQNRAWIQRFKIFITACVSLDARERKDGQYERYRNVNCNRLIKIEFILKFRNRLCPLSCAVNAVTTTIRFEGVNPATESDQIEI